MHSWAQHYCKPLSSFCIVHHTFANIARQVVIRNWSWIARITLLFMWERKSEKRMFVRCGRARRAKFAIKIPRRSDVHELGNSSYARARARTPKPLRVDLLYGTISRSVLMPVVLSRVTVVQCKNKWRKSATARRTFGCESRCSIA